MKNLPVEENEVKVSFVDLDNQYHEGIFIPKENIFFIGFGESGSFKFPFELKSWKYLSVEEGNQTN